MFAISVSWRDMPESLIKYHQLQRRVIRRTEQADREIRFSYRDPEPVLPAWVGLELGIYPWGNLGIYQNGKKKCPSQLPQTGWIGIEDLEATLWQELAPEEVDIPACYGLAKGVWYHILEGLKGVLVRDERGMPHVYMQTKPATHYWRVMTGLDRMPVLIGQEI